MTATKLNQTPTTLPFEEGLYLFKYTIYGKPFVIRVFKEQDIFYNKIVHVHPKDDAIVSTFYEMTPNNIFFGFYEKI